jgi:hypothetical protein
MPRPQQISEPKPDRSCAPGSLLANGEIVVDSRWPP